MRSRRSLIANRLDVCVRGWPRPIARDLRRYLAAAPGTTRLQAAVTSAERHDYCWLLLPQWMLARDRGRQRRGLLGDILWGQYCLFLFARMQDDLFDGQWGDPSLLVAADILLVESQRAFAKHFDGGPFWTHFRRLLDTSVKTVVEVRALQQRPAGLRPCEVDVYARLSAILKTGTAAACVARGRLDEWRHAGRFLDGMAVASQVLDDLLDIEEDLQGGRLNFAASTLLGGRRARWGSKELQQRLARSTLVGDGLDRIFAEVSRHLARAHQAAAALALPDAASHVENWQRSLARLDDHLHRSRVRWIFR